ncbi:MAG: GIY-YIG nuclease family protein [Bacteroidota bacterium]
MARKSYWTYILASRTRVLYVGVTNDLARRVAEHRLGAGGAFTKRYKVRHLVHAEEHAAVRDAIQREKQIKGWTRARKVSLVEAANLTWRDLAEAQPDPEAEPISDTEAV